MGTARAAAAVLGLLLVPLGTALAGPASDLDAAAAAAARDRWDEARGRLADAAAGLTGLPRPEAEPGAGLSDRLAEADGALGNRDLAGARRALGAARAGVVHAALEAALGALARGAPNLSALDEAVDLHRPGAGLADLLARLEQDPGNRSLQDWASHRLLDRTAERARVELELASLAAQQGLPDEAASRGPAAHALARALEGEARLLNASARAAWDADLAGWPARAAALDGAWLRGAAEDLRPALLALGLGRTVTPLDLLGDRLLTAALAAEAAERARRDLGTVNASRLRNAAIDHLEETWRALEDPLWRDGEGSADPARANVTRLLELVRAAGPLGFIRDAAERLRENLRDLAHLTFGAFAKIEYVNVPRNRTVNFTIQAGRFPLEGVAAWEAQVRFDPAVATLEAFHPRIGAATLATWDNQTGRFRARVEGDLPERNAYLANVVFRAAGGPGAQTLLPFEHFQLETPDGVLAELFLLREGRIEVASYDPDQAAQPPAGDPEKLELSNPALGRRAPGPPAALALGLAGLLLGAPLRGRGGGQGEPGQGSRGSPR